MTTAEEQLAHGSEVLQRVCGEVAAIFSRKWGRGPERTMAYWAGPDVLLIVLENGHTPAEKTLRAAGYIQELVGGRQLLQVIVEDELREAVEAATGRSVNTVLSATRLDPDVSAEVFLFEPRDGEPPSHSEMDERAKRAQATSAELREQTRAVSAQARQQVERGARRRKD